MPIQNFTQPAEPTSCTLTIALTPQEYELLVWLGREVGYDTAELLADFVADLTSSTRSGGSDERDHAFAWFKRRGYAGCYPNHQEAVQWRREVEAQREKDYEDDEDAVG